MIKKLYWKIIIAILITGAVGAIQWVLWPELKPYTWLLFYPAVFISAVLGGRWAAIAAAISSAAIAIYFFIEPINTFIIGSMNSLYSILVFVGMGVLFGNLQENYYKAQKKGTESLARLKISESSLQKQNVNLEELVTKRSKELMVTEQRFSTLVENMSEGAQILDFDWKYVYLNDQAEVHNRRSSEELLGKVFTEVWPGIERTILYKMIKKSMEERVATKCEDVFLFNNDVPVWIEFHIQPIPEGVFIVSDDITDRKNAIIEAEETRSILDAALASTPDAIVITDKDGRLVDFNDAFVAYTGYKDKAECARELAAYSAKFEILYPNGKPAPMSEWVTPRALRGETATDVLLKVRNKETGEAYFRSYSFAPIRDKNGEITGSISVGRTVSESK